MAQSKEVRGVATSIRHENGRTIVRYHATDVVEFDADTIVLRTGGWWTSTTKLRLNQASHQFGLGYHVYSEGGNWYVQVGQGGEGHLWVGEEFVIPRG